MAVAAHRAACGQTFPVTLGVFFGFSCALEVPYVSDNPRTRRGKKASRLGEFASLVISCNIYKLHLQDLGKRELANDGWFYESGNGPQ